MPGHRVLLSSAITLGGLLGAGVVTIATQGAGLNLSPDSTQYLAGARALAGGVGFAGIDGQPQSLYPPGLSAVLLIGALVEAPVGFLRGLNVVLIAAIAVGVGLALARVVRPLLAVAAAVVVGLAFPVVMVATWGWSEPLFIALSLVYLALLVAARAAQRPVLLAVLAGLVAGTAVLTRFSGVSLLPVGVLALLSLAGRRVAALAALGGGFTVVVGPWLLRNHLVTGSVTGERFPNKLSAAAIAKGGTTTLFNWFVPAGVPSGVRILLAVVVLACAALTTYAVQRRARDRREPTDPRVVVLSAALLYVITAFATLVVMTARTNIDPLSDRLLSPLAAPLIITLIIAADMCLDTRRAPVIAAALLLFTASGGTLIGRTAYAAGAGTLSALGYNAPLWQSAETRDLVMAPPSGATVTSNQPWGIYSLTGRAVRESPRQFAYGSNSRMPEDIEGLKQLVASGPVYLVWIEGPQEYHLTAAELGATFGVEELDRSSSGAVYRLTRP